MVRGWQRVGSDLAAIDLISQRWKSGRREWSAEFPRTIKTDYKRGDEHVLKTQSVAILVLAAFLAGMVATVTVESAQPGIPVVRDTRSYQLREFFARYNCSDQYDKAYIKAADQYGIDYRLLPAISVRESTCGRYYPRASNNLWGYGSASGLWDFQSVDQGIDLVTKALEQGSHYRDATIPQKLRAYGPSSNPDYPNEVIRLMSSIGG